MWKVFRESALAVTAQALGRLLEAFQATAQASGRIQAPWGLQAFQGTVDAPQCIQVLSLRTGLVVLISQIRLQVSSTSTEDNRRRRPAGSPKDRRGASNEDLVMKAAWPELSRMWRVSISGRRWTVMRRAAHGMDLWGRSGRTAPTVGLMGIPESRARATVLPISRWAPLLRAPDLIWCSQR
jgi:hypothetical protein